MDVLLDLTSRVEATHFWFRGFRRFVMPAIAEVAGARRDLHLLDCGCGTGYNLATLLHPYGRAFGFDLTPGGLLLARAAGVPLARADMRAIPFQTARFDLVTSFDVMQYVDDDDAVMKEMARLEKNTLLYRTFADYLQQPFFPHASVGPPLNSISVVGLLSIAAGIPVYYWFAKRRKQLG